MEHDQDHGGKVTYEGGSEKCHYTVNEIRAEGKWKEGGEKRCSEKLECTMDIGK